MEDEVVLLRQINEDDTNNILKWRNSIEVKKYFIMQNDLSREEHLKWLKEKVYKGEALQFIIHEKNSDIDVGTVYIRNIDKEHLNGEFGIYIGESKLRGKGLGTSSMNLICEYAFKNLKLHKIYLRVLETNKTAINMYQKCGFKIEGNFKEHIINNSKYENLVFMGRINPYE